MEKNKLKEAALELVKEGAGLIKESRERLKKLENKFEEVKKGLGQDTNGD